MTEEYQASVVSTHLTEEGPQLILRGQVNVCAAAELQQAALRLLEQGRDLHIHCEQVDYFDVSAVQILLALHEKLRPMGKSFHLSGASPAVQNLLRLAGVAAMLLDAPTLPAAVAG